MPAARPSESTYPSWAEIADKWLVYNGQVYHVRSMPAKELEAMVQSLTTKTIRTEMELYAITDYTSDHTHWFLVSELFHRGLLVLYGTQQEAEHALLPPPVMLKPKRLRNSRKAS